MTIYRAGIIGAGCIGTTVAHAIAQKSGYKVILVDVAQKQLEKAKQLIVNETRRQRFFNDGQPSLDPDEILSNITLTTSYQQLAKVDYVIENIIEKWAIKQRLYQDIDTICPKHVIFAANTSTIKIEQIADATSRPAQIIGLHFMNPATVINTVEVVRSKYTSDESITITLNFLIQIGKAGIVVNDGTGFVINRVLMLTINEAIWLLQDKISTPSDIDKLFRNCLGYKMGPLETADLIGLDTVLYSLESLHESFQDPKFKPCPLLEQMVESGSYGSKSGQGFYTHYV